MIAVQNPVIHDLWEAIHDDEMSDISLIGHDGEVRANRFILAARSKVLKKMLYGPFLESQSTEIPMYEYEKIILEAVVEFCCKNEISKFRLYIHRNALSARRLVRLFKAADYLQLTGLAKLVAQMAHNLTTRYPPLACAVYDEADYDNKVSNDSLMMIQCRPYVTLPPDDDTGGGVDQLSEIKLLTIYKDKEVKASELFLFEMLQKWREHSESANATDVAKICGAFIQLENIEPQDLLGVVMKSDFCSQKQITDAITRQALRASQNKVWSLSSRGRPNIERILVEGAGSKDSNGIYYKIEGLSNGELYSKREVACGQQHVYTLSVSVNKDNSTVECRIFCSKLLTHGGTMKMIKTRPCDPTFQPILQITRMSEETIDEQKITVLQVSDGENFIAVTLTPRFNTAKKYKELGQNTLIKVLGFERTMRDGKTSFQINKLCIISQDPGHRFGNPVHYFDVYDDVEDDDAASIVQRNIEPIENEIYQNLLRVPPVPAEAKGDKALLELYSCQYPLNEKPVDSKIPNIGWQIDSQGIAPGPRCRWIPSPQKEPETTSMSANVKTAAIAGSSSYL